MDQKEETKPGRRQDGTHLILELCFECFPKELNSTSFCRKLFTRALEKGGFRIIQLGFHKFKPCGLTGFFLLSESHLALHTWPEEKYMALDLFTCGDESEAREAIGYLLEELEKLSSVKVEEKRLKRGFVYQS